MNYFFSNFSESVFNHKLRCLWNDTKANFSRNKQGLRLSDDEIAMRRMFTGNLKDLGNVSEQSLSARDFLQKKFPGKVDMVEKDNEGPQFHFSVGKNFGYPRVKFYVSAKINSLRDLIVDFTQLILPLNIPVKFKSITNNLCEGKAIENRFLIYAPAEHLDKIIGVIKKLDKNYFFPLDHIYGIPVVPGVCVFLITKKSHEAMTERIEERVYLSYSKYPDKFDDFYLDLKKKLSKFDHFSFLREV